MSDKINDKLSTNPLSSYIDKHNRISERTSEESPIEIYAAKFENMYLDDISWHWHEEMEIIYIISGSAVVKVCNHNYALEAGQAIFINQNILHSAKKSLECAERCKYLIILFHPNYLLGYQNPMVLEKYINLNLYNSSFPCILINNKTEHYHHFLECIENAFSAFTRKGVLYELYIRESVLHFFILLLEHYIAISKEKSFNSINNNKLNLDEERAKNAIYFIESHYTDQITLDEIATSIHLSKSECCRCLKRCLNTTPFEYLMRYRIYQSTLLISNSSSLTVSEIALNVGFNSSSYFNKLFKKYLSCTPSQYKKSFTLNVEHELLPSLEEMPDNTKA